MKKISRFLVVFVAMSFVVAEAGVISVLAEVDIGVGAFRVSGIRDVVSQDEPYLFKTKDDVFREWGIKLPELYLLRRDVGSSTLNRVSFNKKGTTPEIRPESENLMVFFRSHEMVGKCI